MTDDLITIPAPAPQDDGVLPSILGELRAARAKIGSGADPLDVVIPGYGGRLVVRFRWIPIRDLSKSAQSLAKIKEPTVQVVAAAADALVATCSEVLVKVEDEVLPLSTNEAPVTFSDPRLAFALGFAECSSARDQTIRAFANEYALIEVANRVVSWLQDTSREVDAEYVGE